MSTIREIGRNKISNCGLPSEKQKSIKFEVNYNDGQRTTINLIDFFTNKTISFAQTIYFYNPNNIGVTLIVGDTSQRIFIPPLKCGYIPILVGDDGIIDVIPQGNGTTNLDLHIINVPIYPIIFDVVSMIF